MLNDFKLIKDFIVRIPAEEKRQNALKLLEFGLFGNNPKANNIIKTIREARSAGMNDNDLVTKLKADLGLKSFGP